MAIAQRLAAPGHRKQLNLEIAAMACSDPDLGPPSGSYGHANTCRPMLTLALKKAQPLALVKRKCIKLAVLARSMQALSPQLCAALAGRTSTSIPVPYPASRALGRIIGPCARVKIIDAKAQHVTTGLGPIIEQDIAQMTHAMTPHDLVQMGSDIELMVLARAVRRHVEHRRVLNERRTVVFR